MTNTTSRRHTLVCSDQCMVLSGINAVFFSIHFKMIDVGVVFYFCCLLWGLMTLPSCSTRFQDITGTACTQLPSIRVYQTFVIKLHFICSLYQVFSLDHTQLVSLPVQRHILFCMFPLARPLFFLSHTVYLL